jgi:hypothetical protein
MAPNGSGATIPFAQTSRECPILLGTSPYVEIFEALTLKFERDFELGSIRLDLSVTHLQIKLDNFRNTKITKRFRGPLDR